MKLLSIPAALLAAGLAAQADGGAGAWSRFRGPNGTGVAAASGLPDRLDPATTRLFATPLPPGRSSPVLWGERLFVTGAEGNALLTICVDARTGKELWRRRAPRARATKVDKRNGPASPTPACGAEIVVVFFPDFGLLAYDHDGNERWRVPLGPFDNVYGMGASPILHRGRVFLPCDQNRGSFLVGVDAETGDVAWKVDRPHARSGHCTPVAYEAEGGSAQIVLPGSFQLDAYAADSGQHEWFTRGLCFEMKSTPVLHDGVIFINGYGSPMNQPGQQVEVPDLERYDRDEDGTVSKAEMPRSRARTFFGFVDLDRDGKLDGMEWNYLRAALASQNGMLAIRAGGAGDTTKQSVLWSYRRSVPQLPSPLLYGGVLYMLHDQGGVLVLLDPKTGKVVERGRLKDAVDSYYASPVAGDGKIYFASESGLVTVLREGGGLAPLSVSDLGERCYATPAIANGRVYVRTMRALHCFMGPRAAPAPRRAAMPQDEEAARRERRAQNWIHPPAIDLGELRVGQRVVGRFRIRNPNRRAYDVRNITSSCACQKVVLRFGSKRYEIPRSGCDPISVPAGATGTMEVHLTVPQGAGRVVTEVRVETTDPKLPAVRVGVFHTAVKEFVLEAGGKRTESLDLGELPADAERDYEFVVRARDGKPFTILGHGPLPATMTLSFASANPERSVWKVRGKVGPNLPRSGFSGLVSVRTDRPEGFTIHVYASVRPRVRVEPGTTLMFGRVPRARGATRSIRVTATAATDTVRIEKHELFDVPEGLVPAGQRIAVRAERDAGGRGATVRVTLPENLRPGRFAVGLRLHFAEGAARPVELRLVGWVR